MTDGRAGDGRRQKQRKADGGTPVCGRGSAGGASAPVPPPAGPTATAATAVNREQECSRSCLARSTTAGLVLFLPPVTN